MFVIFIVIFVNFFILLLIRALITVVFINVCCSMLEKTAFCLLVRPGIETLFLLLEIFIVTILVNNIWLLIFDSRYHLHCHFTLTVVHLIVTVRTFLALDSHLGHIYTALIWMIGGMRHIYKVRRRRCIQVIFIFMCLRSWFLILWML